LFNPVLKAQKNSNVFIEKYNILETWPHEKADLVIAANILNPGYFTATEMEQALLNLRAALNQSARIVIIDNRPSEKSTIFQFTGGSVRIEKKVNGGTDIEDRALGIFSKVIIPTR
jgi:chemotaxis methyl-accepting protein methylase